MIKQHYLPLATSGSLINKLRMAVWLFYGTVPHYHRSEGCIKQVFWMLKGLKPKIHTRALSQSVHRQL